MNVPELQAKLKRLVSEIAYTQADMKGFAEIVNSERKKGFERGEGPDGVKWKPLKPETIQRKRVAQSFRNLKRNKHGNITGVKKGSSIAPEKPLIDRGNLMNATTSASKTEGKVSLAKSRSESVWGSYSISMIHDKGTSKIPQRHHWGIYAEARKRILEAHAARIRRIVKGIF